jgi:hypothetical protein
LEGGINMSNVYVKHGYKDREDYLKSLAEQYSIDYDIVLELANTLGPNEDFDGLVSELEDIESLFENDLFGGDLF